MKLTKHRLTIMACIVSGLLCSMSAVAESEPFKESERTTTALQVGQSAAADRDAKEALKDAVVHVYVVKHTYNTLSPWNSNTRKGSGSGLIIEGGLVLTNAHVAADATFLELQRHGETKRHEAEVVYISHEADLALLRTKEKDLYKDIKPLELGELPEVQQDVEVYGFPIGGTTLSVTRGVVSRIEKQDYAHANENLIAVQVDAAINFGNSGGPVISGDKVVGVAMQSGFFTENIGYMIPTPILRHFLKDVEDGKQDGFGYPGFQVQSMENPAMRRKYGLNEDQTGILVHKVYENTPSEGLMEVGDIITAIDGYSIENNGTVEFRPGEYIDYTHYIDLHQLGEEVKLDIVRDNKPMQVAITLDKPGKDYLLVKPNQYDKQPTYYIHGGFVFMPLNKDLLDSMDPVPASLAAVAMNPPTDELREVVIMTKVLPADINKDYHHDTGLVIEKINGETFADFNEFFEKIQMSQSDYILLEADNGYQVVIDNNEAKAKQPSILARYGINADRSKDLLNRPQLKTADDPGQTRKTDQTNKPKAVEGKAEDLLKTSQTRASGMTKVIPQ